MNATIAIDIGGTSIKGALFTRDGEAVAHRWTLTFQRRHGPLESLALLIRALISDGHGFAHTIDAIGLASPGIIANGSVLYSANLGWENLPLAQHVHDLTGIPTYLDHDARAAARAELTLARSQRPHLNNFVFIPIGTGIAAALYCDGRFLNGNSGIAGEFGHQIVTPGGEICACGQRGCIEAYASAASITRRYRARGPHPANSAEDILTRYNTDPIAAQIWEEALDALATGISSLANILDPALIVLGGGLAEAGHPLLHPLTSRLQSALTWRTPPPLELSTIGPYAGILGAALTAGAPETTEFVKKAHASLHSTSPSPIPETR